MIVHLVDGTYEAFRHFYELRRLTKGKDRPKRSGKASIGAQYLRVDPSAIRSGQEGHYAGDVFRLTQSFERRHFSKFFDLRLSLPFQKQLRRDWARGYRVYSYVSATQFIGKNSHQAFHACFGSDVGTIIRKRFRNDAG